MPTYHCSVGGCHPKGLKGEGGKCPYWGDPVCSLEPEKHCPARSVTFTDQEIRAREHVPDPPLLSSGEILAAANGRPVTDIVAGVNKDLLDRIYTLTATIHKADPVQTDVNAVRAYLDDPDSIGTDMCTISTCLQYISICVADNISRANALDTQIRQWKARKAEKIKKSVSEGVRAGRKASDKSLELMLDADPDMARLVEVRNDARHIADVLDAMVRRSDQHINVLKKRHEYLIREYDRTKYQS